MRVVAGAIARRRCGFLILIISGACLGAAGFLILMMSDCCGCRCGSRAFAGDAAISYRMVAARTTSASGAGARGEVEQRCRGNDVVDVVGRRDSGDGDDGVSRRAREFLGEALFKGQERRRLILLGRRRRLILLRRRFTLHLEELAVFLRRRQCFDGGFGVGACFGVGNGFVVVDDVGEHLVDFGVRDFGGHLRFCKNARVSKVLRVGGSTTQTRPGWGVYNSDQTRSRLQSPRHPRAPPLPCASCPSSPARPRRPPLRARRCSTSAPSARRPSSAAPRTKCGRAPSASAASAAPAATRTFDGAGKSAPCAAAAAAAHCCRQCRAAPCTCGACRRCAPPAANRQTRACSAASSCSDGFVNPLPRAHRSAGSKFRPRAVLGVQLHARGAKGAQRILDAAERNAAAHQRDHEQRVVAAALGTTALRHGCLGVALGPRAHPDAVDFCWPAQVMDDATAAASNGCCSTAAAVELASYKTAVRSAADARLAQRRCCLP